MSCLIAGLGEGSLREECASISLQLYRAELQGWAASDVVMGPRCGTQQSRLTGDKQNPLGQRERMKGRPWSYRSSGCTSHSPQKWTHSVWGKDMGCVADLI